MENRGDEEIRGKFHNSLLIFIVICISSISLPFRCQFFGLKFTDFLETNDRHCIFVLFNCVLFLLYFLDSGTNQANLIECDKISVASVHDHGDSWNHVHNEHELAIEVKQSEQSGILVRDDDDRIEAPETEHGNEIVANVVVEEEEHHDQEEAKEFQQKCEAFIKKVKQSMHHEGRLPYAMIGFQESAD
ncbi:hypothetical protein L1987_40054 [Smallanthus sonchifolius]|uniref:Uncharacterized protein n=1 Tax=Smallanthus sonchifolius TaxID=185202 RepID=A0ACB9GTA7_9ASTR|nr:hypothetical protein L1987_40054 [Smallanthus sonchifolius]